MRTAAEYQNISVLSIRGYRRQLLLQGKKRPQHDSFSHLKLCVVDPVDGEHKRFNGELAEFEAAELLRVLQTLQDAGLIAGSSPAWDEADDPAIMHAAKLMQYLLTEKNTAEDASGSAEIKAEQAPCIASEPPEAP